MDVVTLTIIVLVLLIISPWLIIIAKKIIREESRGRDLPLTNVQGKLEFGLIAGLDKAIIRFQAKHKGPYVEFRKSLKKRKANRIQMILEKEICGQEIFDKVRVALDNKDIPYYLQESDENNSRTLIIECGRNFDLANASAIAVLTEGFGIPPEGLCLHKEIGNYSLYGMGFGQSDECLFYGIIIEIDQIPSVVDELMNSHDEDAFVLFGHKCIQLPKLKKEFDKDGKISFVLEYPIHNHRTKDVVRMLEKDMGKFSQVDQAKLARFYNTPDNLLVINEYVENRQKGHYKQTYRIPLGSDPKMVSEKLKPILRNSGLYLEAKYNPTKIKCRLSEFVTADWKPKDGESNETTQDKSNKSGNDDMEEICES